MGIDVCDCERCTAIAAYRNWAYAAEMAAAELRYFDDLPPEVERTAQQRAARAAAAETASTAVLVIAKMRREYPGIERWA